MLKKKLWADKEKPTKEYSGKEQKILKSMWSPKQQKDHGFQEAGDSIDQNKSLIEIN